MQLPDSVYVRRKTVQEFLGVRRHTLDKLVESGQLRVVHFLKDSKGRPVGHGLFVRAEVAALGGGGEEVTTECTETRRRGETANYANGRELKMGRRNR